MAKLQIYLPDNTIRTHDLVEDVTKVGRVADNDLQIEEDSISSHHAEIHFQNGTYVLKDLGSTNGTFCNDVPATETLLADGDRVRFGKVDALFLAEETEEVGAATPLPSATESTAIASHQTALPVDFVNSSPFPRKEATRDPMRTVAYGLAVISLLVVLMAIYGALVSIQTPTFPQP